MLKFHQRNKGGRIKKTQSKEGYPIQDSDFGGRECTLTTLIF